MPQRFQIAGQTVDGVERGRIVDQPMRQVCHRPGMRNVMALDQIAEQDGVKVFLMNFNPQVPLETRDFGKASALPILLERLLDSKASSLSRGALRYRSPCNRETP